MNGVVERGGTTRRRAALHGTACPSSLTTKEPGCLTRTFGGHVERRSLPSLCSALSARISRFRRPKPIWFPPFDSIRQRVDAFDRVSASLGHRSTPRHPATFTPIRHCRPAPFAPRSPPFSPIRHYLAPLGPIRPRFDPARNLLRFNAALRSLALSSSPDAGLMAALRPSAGPSVGASSPASRAKMLMASIRALRRPWAASGKGVCHCEMRRASREADALKRGEKKKVGEKSGWTRW